MVIVISLFSCVYIFKPIHIYINFPFIYTLKSQIVLPGLLGNSADSGPDPSFPLLPHFQLLPNKFLNSLPTLLLLNFQFQVLSEDFTDTIGPYYTHKYFPWLLSY